MTFVIVGVILILILILSFVTIHICEQNEEIPIEIYQYIQSEITFLKKKGWTETDIEEILDGVGNKIRRKDKQLILDRITKKTKIKLRQQIQEAADPYAKVKD